MDASPTTTTYQLQTPTGLWQTWRRTVPRDMTLNRRLVALLAADVLGRIDTPSVETDDSDETPARSVAVDDVSAVVDALLESPAFDLGPLLADELAVDDATNDRITLIQIRKHAMRASQQIGSDADAAREEIREITNLLDQTM